MMTGASWGQRGCCHPGLWVFAAFRSSAVSGRGGGGLGGKWAGLSYVSGRGG